MPQLISVGSKLFRINLALNRIESSATGGYTWVPRCKLSDHYGKAKDLLSFHNKLFLLTEKGIYFSRNEGADWGRCGSGKIVESLVALQDGGNCILGLSAEGRLYFSNNEGADWGGRG